jgi:nicotinate-nucleotide pyrophosphorylase (carboxylating)
VSLKQTNTVAFDALIAVALAEDLGEAGDVTSLATVAAEARASGALIAREPGVIAGLEAARAVFAAVDSGTGFTALVAEGAHVQTGDVLTRVGDLVRALLAAERIALNRALAGSGGLDVQVEVDSLEELDKALAAGARSVLLDNFGVNDLFAAVARCRRETQPVFIEASGGITLSGARVIASTGVNAIAVGALTHSARALDIGLDLSPGEDLTSAAAAGGWASGRRA